MIDNTTSLQSLLFVCSYTLELAAMLDSIRPSISDHLSMSILT